MKRIAALLAFTALPMVSLAQAVSYAARHPSAPGHAIARQIVERVSQDLTGPRGQPRVVAPQGPDSPVARELTGASRAAIEQTGPGAIAQTQRGPDPDRKKVAELVRQHQPAVVRGDTAVEYVVMVVDAADTYLWSTIGSGNVSIEIAGDPRTPSERAAFTRAHTSEFWGPYGLAALVPSTLRDSATHLVAFTPTLWLHADTIQIAGDSIRWKAFQNAGGGARGGRGGGAGADTGLRVKEIRLARFTLDSVGRDSSVFWIRSQIAGRGVVLDSVHFKLRGGRVGSDSSAGGRGSASTATAGAGARGGRGALPINSTNDKPGVYKNGWAGTRNGSQVNQAYGLSDVMSGQSGIQGIPSAWVSAADTYHFAEKELAPRALQVMVVRLTPDAKWKPRTP